MFTTGKKLALITTLTALINCSERMLRFLFFSREKRRADYAFQRET